MQNVVDVLSRRSWVLQAKLRCPLTRKNELHFDTSEFVDVFKHQCPRLQQTRRHHMTQ